MTDGARDREDDAVEDLDTETVEDLDVDEVAEDVQGGTAGCHTMTF